MPAEETKAEDIRSKGPKLRERTGRIPVVDVVSEGVRTAFVKNINEKTTKKTFQDLMLRKLPLESVVSGLAKGALTSVERIFKEGEKTSILEERLNKQYRDSLLERKLEGTRPRARRARKEEYQVSGRILHPLTGKPVPGIVVTAVDKDVSKHDYVGIDISDASGNFEISFTEKEFMERGEGEPEIFIKAGMDRETAVVVNESPLRPKPGIRETFDIALPAGMERSADRITLRRQRVDKKRLAKADQDILVNNMSRMVVEEMGKAFKEGLNAIISLFEKRQEEVKHRQSRKMKGSKP